MPPQGKCSNGAAAPPPRGDSALNPDPLASPRHELGGWVRWVSRGWVTPTEPRHCPCPDAAFSVRLLSTSVAHNRIDGTHSAVGKRGGSRACAWPKGPQGAGRRAPARHEPAAGAALPDTPGPLAASRGGQNPNHEQRSEALDLPPISNLGRALTAERGRYARAHPRIPTHRERGKPPKPEQPQRGLANGHASLAHR